MTESARESILSEAAFGPMLGKRATEFMHFGRQLIAQPGSEIQKKHLTRLVELAHDLETFLDDYGARNNKAYSYLTELIASLRGMGKAGVALSHLRGRLPRYALAIDASMGAEFAAETERTNDFLLKSIMRLLDAVEKEFDGLSIAIDPVAEASGVIAESGPRIVLPHNIDEEEITDEQQKIAEVATRYLAVSDRLRQTRITKIHNVDSLRGFVLKQMDEERVRALESQIHSIQSKYDTFIRATTLESRTPALSSLRGHASLALHLVEVGMELVHFYVRHENDVRYEVAKQRIANLIAKQDVLDRFVNYSIYFTDKILDVGRASAEEVLRAFIKTQEAEFVVPDGVILHARPISLIVRIVSHYGTPVRMEIEEEDCDAGSIMETILVVGSHPDARTVRFRGDSRVLSDVKLLFEHRLGEDGVSGLPTALDYLKK